MSRRSSNPTAKERNLNQHPEIFSPFHTISISKLGVTNPPGAIVLISKKCIKKSGSTTSTKGPVLSHHLQSYRAPRPLGLAEDVSFQNGEFLMCTETIKCDINKTNAKSSVFQWRHDEVAFEECWSHPRSAELATFHPLPFPGRLPNYGDFGVQKDLSNANPQVWSSIPNAKYLEVGHDTPINQKITLL